MKKVRGRYLGDLEERKAMQPFVGIRKDRSESVDSSDYIRNQRRGDRLERLLPSSAAPEE